MKLTEVNKIFEAFFNAHLAVNSYSFGVLEDFITIPDKEYIAVNCEFVRSNYDDVFVTHQFSFSVSDLMSSDYPETEHDAISNCIEVARDFIAYLKSREFTFTNGNIEPFREDTGDLTAGVVFSLSLQVYAGYNECAIAGYSGMVSGSGGYNYGQGGSGLNIETVILATSASYAINAGYAATASYALNAGATVDTASFVLTSSFNDFTASYINNIPDASQTERGLVNTTSQIFAGNKTFTGIPKIFNAGGAALNFSIGAPDIVEFRMGQIRGLEASGFGTNNLIIKANDVGYLSAGQISADNDGTDVLSWSSRGVYIGTREIDGYEDLYAGSKVSLYVSGSVRVNTLSTNTGSFVIANETGLLSTISTSSFVTTASLSIPSSSLVFGNGVSITSSLNLIYANNYIELINATSSLKKTRLAANGIYMSRDSDGAYASSILTNYAGATLYNARNFHNFFTGDVNRMTIGETSVVIGLPTTLQSTASISGPAIFSSTISGSSTNNIFGGWINSGGTIRTLMGSNSEGLVIDRIGSSTTHGLYLKHVGGNVSRFQYNTADGSTELGSISNGALKFYVSGSERARIAPSTGNFLIGTTTDSGFKLEVNGSAKVGTAGLNVATTGVDGYIRASGTEMVIGHTNSSIHIRIQGSNTTQFQQVCSFINGMSIIPGGNSATFALSVGSGSFPNSIPFSVNSDKLRVAAVTGHVLVGTTTDAGFRLNVNGVAKASAVVVTYTPTGSTDPTYPTGSIVSDDDFIYRRNNAGNWTKIAWGAF